MKGRRKTIKILFWIGLLGGIQYFFITSGLMYIYPGGSYFDRSSMEYSFMHNFLSDLGRTTNFGRQINPTAPWYRFTLGMAGISVMSFISGFSLLFQARIAQLSAAAWILGVLAGICYIGIAFNPVNESYFTHIQFVQWGFLSFLGMCIICAIILRRAGRPVSPYASWLWLFILLLAIQVSFMILGPRSWSSVEALRLQVILQKLVVYSEILALSGLCFLCLRYMDSLLKAE